MKLLLDTDEIVIAEKEAGILSEESAEPNIVSALKEELGCEMFPVHRLDRAVGGVMVFGVSGARLKMGFMAYLLELLLFPIP